jgi:nitroimidazol reductase NimA-like FMN-containing flavoprotein (pyridoxamine 5'-phosphate oxidase superfamily)
MNKIDFSSRPLNHITRENRAVHDEAWIKAMLRRAPYGMLATSQDGQPFIHTSLFVFDEAIHAIYIHSALDCRRRTNLEANPRVCFTVTEMGRLLPGSAAMDFGVEYSGVVVFGKAVILSDEDEARHGLQMLLDKYFPHLKPGKDYSPIAPEEIAITSVYRLEIEQWSGKLDQAPANYPGAFEYGKLP